MNVKSIFITIFLIVLVVNIFYISSTPERIFNMAIGGLIGFALCVTPIILLGATALGNQILSETSQKILMSLIFYINVFFGVEIYGVSVGLGLMNNVYLALGGETSLGLGFMITSVLTIMIFVFGIWAVLE